MRSTGEWDAHRWHTPEPATVKAETPRLDPGRWDMRKWGRYAFPGPRRRTGSTLRLCLWAGFFAMLPDLLDSVPLWESFIRTWPGTAWFSHFHHGIQPHLSHQQWPLGIGTQVLVVAAAVWVLSARKERARPPA